MTDYVVETKYKGQRANKTYFKNINSARRFYKWVKEPSMKPKLYTEATGKEVSLKPKTNRQQPSPFGFVSSPNFFSKYKPRGKNPFGF